MQLAVSTSGTCHALSNGFQDIFRDTVCKATDFETWSTKNERGCHDHVDDASLNESFPIRRNYDYSRTFDGILVLDWLVENERNKTTNMLDNPISNYILSFFCHSCQQQK